jgi:hypothetical protein
VRRILVVDDSGTAGPQAVKKLATALSSECIVEYWEIHKPGDCDPPKELKTSDFSYRTTPISWSEARQAICEAPPDILVADLDYDKAVDIDSLEGMGKEAGPLAELIRKTFDEPGTRRGWLAGAVLVSDFWTANPNGGVVVHSDFWQKLKPLARKYGRELFGCEAGDTNDLVIRARQILRRVSEGSAGSLSWHERLTAVHDGIPLKLRQSFNNASLHTFNEKRITEHFGWLDTEGVDDQDFRGVLERGRVEVDKSELTWERLKAYWRDESILGSLLASLLEIEHYGQLFGGDLSFRLEFACDDSGPTRIAKLADITASPELSARIKKRLAFDPSRQLKASAEALLIHAFVVLAGGKSVSARATFLSKLDTLVLDGWGPIRTGKRFVPFFLGRNVLASAKGDVTNTLHTLAEQGLEIMQATSIPMLGSTGKAQSPLRWFVGSDPPPLVENEPSFYVADEITETAFVRVKLSTL